MNLIQIDDYDLIKILALGDSQVGKTTFLNRYADGSFTGDFTPTVGIDFREKRIVYHGVKTENGISEKFTRNIHLQLWDTAGQERFRSLTTAFFRDAMGFLLLFDITKEESFTHVREWMSHLECNASYDNPAVILVGNKSDLTVDRVISYEIAEELANTLGIRYLETSALTGENMDEAVNTLLQLTMDKLTKYIAEKKADEESVRGKKLSDIRKPPPPVETSYCGCS